MTNPPDVDDLEASWAATLADDESDDMRETLKAERYRAYLDDEVMRQRARRDARRLLDSEDGKTVEVPEPTLLTTLLDEEDETEAWRIQGVWPRGGHVLLAAGAKAGKTTTTGNTVRVLVDGAPFLGIYPVEPVRDEETVAVLDFEMPRRGVKRWLADQGIINKHCVAVWTERGKAARFDLRDVEIRAKWVERLKAANVKVWIIDCLSPVLSALGISENDNTEVGQLLDGLTSAAAEADVDEVLLIHHMGHGAERSRGASRLIGWPDVNWRILRQRDEKDPNAEPAPDSPRFFSAYGRDVDVREGRLLHDSRTRHLTFVEGGRKATEQSEALAKLLVYVRDNQGQSADAIEKKLKVQGVGRNDVRKALADAVSRGYVLVVPGRSNSRLHDITGTGRATLALLSGADPDDVDMSTPDERTWCQQDRAHITPADVAAGHVLCRACRIEQEAA
ncbi:ATP-binding protein [Catenuloplanes japonicus]|uniref:ATP-binding protein n=1 Tax=Catenuloplanes japonicus TaxID=33876 RepID=UPI00052430D4|nr:AAA family ATPase [Catenuloplanes japonicus]